MEAKIKDYLYKHRAVLLSCIPALVIFLLATYRLPETGQPILFNDEIGYWSNSAFFLGMDWTSVTGKIGYYSYGYSLLLVPLRVMAELFGWSSDMLYHAGIVMNGGFLVGSYLIALKLAGRYLPEMNRVVRTAACFAVCTYSSFLVYAHITWAECTLLFFFWLYLYVMMRLTDKPSVWNHIAFAVISLYMYTVHQRALGIVVTAVLVVLCVRLFRLSRLRDTAAFLGSMYLCGLVHGAVKWNLQHVNYLGEEPAAFQVVVGHAFTGTAKLLFVAGLFLLLLLYLIEKRKYKILLALLAVGIVLAAGLLYSRNGGGGAESAVTADDTETVDTRISTNDFSGQWGVIRNLFTIEGVLRLGISMTGKWFYLASVSGLVICWGIVGLFKNACILFLDVLKRIGKGHRGQEQENPVANGAATEDGALSHRERIWLLGMLMAWFSTFMISAVYKEGFYKNDDLFNGRYVEFTIGFLLLYSLNCLINDKKWVRIAVPVVVLYIAAGHLCQNAINVVGRKEFELAHCVMFGRMVWNYEVPIGKIRVVEDHIFPLAIAFFAVLKLMRDRIPKAAVIRTVLALTIPVVAWSYLGKSIVDHYVVVRNEKQAEPLPQFSTWINVLDTGGGKEIYYLLDSANQRYAGALQYMLQDKPVTVTCIADVPFTEDAFYVVRQEFIDEKKLKENCEIVMHSRGYMLLINKDQELMERWRPFTD